MDTPIRPKTPLEIALDRQLGQDEDERVCHASGDRCHGCDHYHGKAAVCEYAPSQERLDTRKEAIRAMSQALADMGYTRDSDYPGPMESRIAVSAMISKLVELDDFSFAFEFITEGHVDRDRALFRSLAMFMRDPTAKDGADEVAYVLARTARWYGESFLDEAFDMLDSASEIQCGREVDYAIDERKSA